MKYVGYYRVSTTRQGQSGLGLEAQENAVRRHVGTDADGQLLSEFVEVESGTKVARPVLAQAMAECRRQKATLCIARLDRLARNVAFVSTLLDSKVEFVVCDAPHADRMFLQMLSVFAEHEARLISVRTTAALAAAKAKGVKLGSHGAELARAHKAAAVDHAYEVSSQIRRAIYEGAHSCQAVADHLNESQLPSREGGKWYSTSVSRVLKRLEIDLSIYAFAGSS